MSISDPVVSADKLATDLITMSTCCKVYIVFCLVIANIAAEIEQNMYKKESIDSGEIVNKFVVFFCGIAVGVALMMGLTTKVVKASDTDSKVDKMTKKKETMKVYVFKTGRRYHLLRMHIFQT